MKKSEIRVGGKYLAKVDGSVVTVRVNSIREGNIVNPDGITYDVTNLKTGRSTTFRSAAKFRAEVKASAQAKPTEEGEHSSDPTPAASSAVPSSIPQATASSAASLASKIACARAVSLRTPGTPIAGAVPNEEQEAILRIALELYEGLLAEGNRPRCLVVVAGAGTGKTKTSQMTEQTLPGNGQYTAFNSELVQDAVKKFTKCAVNTTHSLAFRAVGKKFAHRLPPNSPRMTSWQLARALGIENMNVVIADGGPPDAEGKATDKDKTISAKFLAGQVMTAIRRFCQSADRELSTHHFCYIDGIDMERSNPVNNDLVKQYLLPFAHKMWNDLTRVDGSLPFSHDVYVKLWQLGTGENKPLIPADYILLDEYQDTAPVFVSILQQQTHALVILLGDDNQRIYEWRGAINAADEFSNAPRCPLSQSYRFGQVIADVANSVLSTLDKPTDLVMRGHPGIPSRVAPVEQPRCFLYRTNASAIKRLMVSIEEGKRPYLYGGGSEVIRWCEAAEELKQGRKTEHPDLACFDSWQELKEYSETDEGEDLKLMVKLAEDFGAKEIATALKRMPSKEADADLVISTAHKSKGREWDSVRLGPDFLLPTQMGDPDRRLLYVAATRAKLTLDVSQCPAFTGGYDRNLERQVPGLKVSYTVPMPSAEDQQKWKQAQQEAVQQARQDAPKTEATAQPIKEVTATYAKLKDDSWGVRSTVEVRPGQEVTVTTKAGLRKVEKIKKVVWSGNGIWLASKEAI